VDEQGLTIPSELGRITIASEAIAQLVAGSPRSATA
jgi:hypothetical protein